MRDWGISECKGGYVSGAIGTNGTHGTHVGVIVPFEKCAWGALGFSPCVTLLRWHLRLGRGLVDIELIAIWPASFIVVILSLKATLYQKFDCEHNLFHLIIVFTILHHVHQLFYR